jgi:hypothetical protein
MATLPWYCTREEVEDALDTKPSPRSRWQLDQAIESSSRGIEGDCHRVFYPRVATRYFDWPNQQRARSWRLWLEENELASKVGVSVAVGQSDGTYTTLDPSDYEVRTDPEGDTGEAPFAVIELDLGGAATWGGGRSHQNQIRVTGPFGFRYDFVTAGTITEALDASVTDVDGSDGVPVGTGSILLVDSELMVVTGRTFMDSGANLSANITASTGDNLLAVSDVTRIREGETVQIGAEQMAVNTVEVNGFGNFLRVDRARDAFLAAHSTGDDVFVPQRFTVERGALGTTAATHLTSAPLSVFSVPGGIRAWCKARAINQYEQERSGYARTVGAGENEREASGKGLAEVGRSAWQTYARHCRGPF